MKAKSASSTAHHVSNRDQESPDDSPTAYHCQDDSHATNATCDLAVPVSGTSRGYASQAFNQVHRPDQLL